jgi:hypothetical protein
LHDFADSHRPRIDFARDNRDHDVPVGQDPHGHPPLGSLVDDDEAADVVVAHKPRRVRERCLAMREHDDTIANITDVHGSPRLTGRRWMQGEPSMGPRGFLRDVPAAARLQHAVDATSRGGTGFDPCQKDIG